MDPKVLLFASLLVTVCCQVSVIMTIGPGQLGEVKHKDEESQALVDAIKPELKRVMGPITRVDVIIYRTQMVNGRNFFIKAEVVSSKDNSSIVHLRIYRPFHFGVPRLVAYLLKRTREEPIEYFD